MTPSILSDSTAAAWMIQVLGMLAAALTVAALWPRERTYIRRLLFVSNLFWALHHTLLGSLGAGVGSVVIAASTMQDRATSSFRWLYLAAGFAAGLLSPGWLALWASPAIALMIAPAVLTSTSAARYALLLGNAFWLVHGIGISSIGAVLAPIVAFGVYVASRLREAPRDASVAPSEPQGSLP